MPRIRNCVICGKEFTSYRGTNVCSEQCKIEKKKDKTKIRIKEDIVKNRIHQ